MLNGLVEDWFDALEIGYRWLLIERRVGIPTVRFEVDFTAISRMGDDVELVLENVVMGARSLTLQLGCMGPGGEACMRMRQVPVTTSLDTHQAIDIPQDVRAAMLAFWLH